jgi:hypothetical protein
MTNDQEQLELDDLGIASEVTRGPGANSPEAGGRTLLGGISSDD